MAGTSCSLLAKMSQDPVDDVLLLDASDDFDSPPAATAQTSMSILNTRLSRWAQVIAAWHSAGVLTTAFAPVLSALPRLAGVTSPRQR